MAEVTVLEMVQAVVKPLRLALPVPLVLQQVQVALVLLGLLRQVPVEVRLLSRPRG